MTGTLLSTSPPPANAPLPPPDSPLGRRPDRPPDPATAAAVRAAAVATLQRILEVLDGRRPRSQLLRCADDEVLAQITALVQHGVVRTGDECARLCRVHVQLRSTRLAEYFGTFVRGDRVRAVAGRIEVRSVRVSAPGELPRRTADRWVVTEFAVV